MLYLIAGDEARVKAFALRLPPTPSESTTHPSLSAEYDAPTALTHTGAVSGIQPLPNGRLLFSRSSLTAPNDVFVIRDLSDFSRAKVEQLTRFTADALSSKDLSEGEDFYFDGAKQKIQGWIVKPPGFKHGEKKKWPIVLLIHGGPQGAWEDQWSTRWNPQGEISVSYYSTD